MPTIKTTLNKRTAKVIYLLILATALAFSINNYTDTDLFYMIPTGNYILQHGIPQINPFVTTSGLQMTIQNWLYCIIIASIYNIARSPGLYIFFMIQIYAMLIVLYKILKPNNDPILAFIATVTSGYTLYYFNIRPEIITTTLVLTQILTLNKYRMTHNRKWLLIWPILTLLEINIHASYWIMHYIILIPYFVPFINTKWVKNDYLNITERKDTVIAILTTIPALFINPYKTKMITYVFQSILSPEFKSIKNYINEQTTGLVGRESIIVLIVTTTVIIITIYKKKLTSTTLYMYIGISILVCATLKWISFEPIVCVLLAKNIINKKTLPIQNLLKNDQEYKKTIYTFILICIGLITLNTQTQTFIPEIYQEMKPLVDKIKNPNAYIYTTFAKSNYLSYRGFKVHHDARPELYTKELSKKSTKILRDLEKILNNNPNPGFYQKFLERENFDYLILSKENTFKLYLNMHPEQYTKISTNKSMTLYKRNDITNWSKKKQLNKTKQLLNLS